MIALNLKRITDLGERGMKIYTKEWYEEMQIAGFLVFHETEKDWEDDVAWYRSEGLNYEQLRRDELEYRKKDLLRFLPEYFHSYIHNGTLNVTYPSEELRNMAKQWQSAYKKRMKTLGDEYRGYYKSIRDSLPDNVIQLCEKSLHDARVISVERPSEDIYIISLDCRGGFYYFTDIQLTFTGVKNVNPDLRVGSDWLYDEVYLTDFGFELHVLFAGPLTEYTIAAEDVRIEVCT